MMSPSVQMCLAISVGIASRLSGKVIIGQVLLIIPISSPPAPAVWRTSARHGAKPQLVPERAVAARRLSHEQRSDVLLCLIGVVRSTPKLEIVDGGRAPICKGNDMMELEEATFPAPARASDEGALRSVPFPDLPLDRG
jgi:hypothetical protein